MPQLVFKGFEDVTVFFTQISECACVASDSTTVLTAYGRESTVRDMFRASTCSPFKTVNKRGMVCNHDRGYFASLWKKRAEKIA